MATIVARLIIQHIFENQILFSYRFGNQNEDGFMLEEIEFFIKLGTNRGLTLNDIGDIIIRFQVEHEIINQEWKDSG